MKRLLSIIGAISLVGTSTTSLVACVNCNCKHAFSKALINKTITSFKINATIF